MNYNPSNEPLVSVVIASYNHAPFVEESIASVLAQTYPHIELLVVDDGSRDDSVWRIKRLQERHGFDFKVKSNQGLSRTLNETIARARGELLAPFGSDDVMLPNRLALQVRHMHDKPEVGICAGNIQQIDAAGLAIGQPRTFAPRRLNFDDIFLNRQPGAPAPTLLIRREAFEKVGGFDPDIRLEDALLELKITYAGYYIDVMAEVLARYRVHANNTYKDHRFMVDNMLRSYAQFSKHPAYEKVCADFRKSMLLKCARSDKPLARELLRQIPLAQWDAKTLRGILRLFLPPSA